MTSASSPKNSPLSVPGTQRNAPAIVILIAAVLIGIYLRFDGLGSREMSADEGASWAAAVAPKVADVMKLQPRLNPGELGLHDLALHGWIRAFGDGLFAIRSLSALIGSLTIILVFLVTRELIQVDSAGRGPTAVSSIDQTAPFSRDSLIVKAETLSSLLPAIAALVFAVNLVTIKYSREARMYPLALALILLQVLFFLRVARLGGVVNAAAVTTFTALSVATTLTAVLIFLPEGLWLIYLVATTRTRNIRRVAGLVVALTGGLVVLVPIAQIYYRTRGGMPNLGVYSWIVRPAPWAPLSLFDKATGSFAFPVMAVLAVWGIFRNRHSIANTTRFAIMWAFAAPVFLLIISYAVQPAFVERYLISCFVPFFVLVALGACSFDSLWARISAVTLVIVLALAHVVRFDQRPHDAQWREGTALAAANVGDEKSIAVAPRYAVNVVRYYLARAPVSQIGAVGYDTPSRVLILADTGVGPREINQLEDEYPRVLARMRGIMLRGR